MKLLLLNPPQIYNSKEEPLITFPLGLGYLASALLKEGYNVEVLDSLAEGYDKKTKRGNKYIIGLTLKEIIQKIKQIKPDALLISCSISVQYPIIEEFMQIIRKESKIIIILGGNHASSQSKGLVSNQNIDFIVTGEGEEEILNLLNDIKNKKHSKKCYKSNPIKNLDKLPFPARRLFPIENYIKANKPHTFFRKKNRILPLITSRGCVYKCPFCASHCVFGYGWRGRSVKNIVAEINCLIKNYNIEEFHIEDDDLLYDSKRINSLLNKLIVKKPRILWTVPNGIRPSLLNKELLIKMKKSGCYALFLAIESGDTKILKSMNKQQDLQRIKNIVDLTKKLKFYVVGFFLLGMPEETEESIAKTIKFSQKLNLDEALFSIVTPYPGTELYKANKKSIKELEDLTPKNANLNTKCFSKKDLKRLRNQAYLKFEINKLLKRPFTYLSLYQIKRLTRYFKYLIMNMV